MLSDAEKCSAISNVYPIEIWWLEMPHLVFMALYVIMLKVEDG